MNYSIIQLSLLAAFLLSNFACCLVNRRIVMTSIDFSKKLLNGCVRAIGVVGSYGSVQQLQEVVIPLVPLKNRQIRVEIEAVSVNPVDTKIRKGSRGGGDLTEPRILGFDGVGTVVEVGPSASLFKPGDKVMYAGVMNKPGTNADFAVVDEQLVGKAPSSLAPAEAAALPLTSLTAWEGLFEQLGLKAFDSKNKGKKLLVLPGAGGVGPIVTQLASKLLGLDVIATASRQETNAICRGHGM
jgi:NADPH:quinone reductase-like Zn-dependent oxidoreductase